MVTNFTPFPVLTTQKLSLREVEQNSNNDVRDIYNIRSNDDINKFIGRKKCESLLQAKEFIQKINTLTNEGNGCYWGVCLKNDTTIIGTALIWNINREEESAEIGYELLPECWGKGLMKEAVECMLEFAFSHVKLKAVDGYVLKSNIKSLGMLEKLGFSFFRQPEEDDAIILRLYNPAL
jgi:ribosomal-protein-alanine N-acetyltransferase